MTSYITKHCQLFGIGTLFLLCGLFSQPATAQCDFINNITGIVQGTLPVGDAADPLLYTQVYVLVDNQGNIFATNPSANFLTVPAGFYNLYAVNYENGEATTVLPLLAIGQPWFNLEVYGNDDVNNCLDYTVPYGSGCPIVVCAEMTICEVDTLNTLALNFNSTDHSQTYCLVCNDVVVDMRTAGLFPLQDYTEAIAAANCQLFGLNFNTNDGNPITIGANWSVTTDGQCASSCIDFVGMSLDITSITQPSGDGISTTVDWWNTSGCVGAQNSTNSGGTFSEVVNNICVPSYNPSPINARPTGGGDDLQQYAAARSAYGRFACSGGMDLTQQPIFYTVECDPTGPSILNVLVSNPGAGITGVQAALYGPVTMPCPTFTGGSFVDCNDAGSNATSGSPLGDITLTTTGNPGDVYLVIVDTEGADQFTISSSVIFLSTKLVSFDGAKAGANNVLTWAVQEEKQVDRYVLERSENGVDFTTLSETTALNNGNPMMFYKYTDLLPGVGLKYYRLKSLAMNGGVEYSNVVVLSRGEDSWGGVAIYPNPTKGTFYIEFDANIETMLTYKIQDIVGQTVKEGVLETDLGLNKIELDLEDFPAATYVVALTLNGQRVQRKLIKQ
jgi:hypothetical protein